MADPAQGVVIWAPRGRDAALAAQLVAHHGLVAVPCSSVEELVAGMTGFGCAVITSECLQVGVRERLAAALASQPPWSDFPIILMVPRGATRTSEVVTTVELLGNVSLLERPVHSGTLISAIVTALRGRRRQYDAREAIVRRDQFLAMLGHELRNPLSVIILAAEVLQQAGGAAASTTERDLIERQARHLARLVDDLLDVARVTSGKLQLQTEPLDLAEIVQRCVRSGELAAQERRVTFELELDADPLIVDGDLVRLEEVFNNLLANAIKYSPEGARVTIGTRRTATTAVVEISDTGIGIAPEMIPRVFDLFTQADSSLDRSRGGLGIGLTLVRALVELHGGKIAVRSAGLGLGSTFSITLPLSHASATTEAPPAQPPRPLQPGRPIRVLIVDDNVDLLEMMRKVLEVEGYEVATAADGGDGLHELTARLPDIAFIDIGLPTLDGYAIASGAREQGVRTFLVAMTGYGQPEDKQRALAAGFDHHVTKPVSPAILHKAIEDAAHAR